MWQASCGPNVLQIEIIARKLQQMSCLKKKWRNKNHQTGVLQWSCWNRWPLNPCLISSTTFTPTLETHYWSHAVTHTHTHPGLCCLLFDYHYMWGLVLLVQWGYFHWAVYLSLWCLWGMSCPKGEIRSAAGVESAFPYLRRLIYAADKVLSWTRCAFVRISTSSTARSKISLSLNF